jgi:hypothetical protein
MARVMAEDRRLGSRPRMSSGKIDSLIAYLIRSAPVFAEAKDVLLGEHFTGEEHFATLWLALVALADRYGHGMITQDMLHHEIEERSRSDLDALPQDMLDELLSGPDAELGPGRSGIIHYAYGADVTASLQEAYGLDLLKQFLAERAVADAMKLEISATGFDTPTNMVQFCERMRAMNSRIETLGTSSIRASFLPDDYIPTVAVTFSTGVPFFNRMMGGQANGEVYGFMAPYGAGKTVVGMQVCVETARVFSQLANRGGELRHAYYFHYEGSTAEMRQRSQTFAAEIEKDTLGSEAAYRQMSRTGRLKPYEIERYRSRGDTDLTNAPGEYERLHAAAAILNRNFHLIDYSGGDHPDSGNRGVAEIEDFLSSEVRAGRIPGMVVIDYCLKAVERELEGKNLDLASNLRLMVRGYPDRCRRQIAARFDLPVWILHQVKGAANDAGPTMKIGMADAAESKSFAENLYFLFGMAKPDDVHHVALLHTAKDRRNGMTGQTQLVRLDGRFARFDPADAVFTVDPATNRIARRDELNPISGGGTFPTPLPPPVAAPAPANRGVLPAGGRRRWDFAGADDS